MSHWVQDSLDKKPTSPLHVLTGVHDHPNRADTILSPRTPAWGHHATKLPRDGYKGGGTIRMSNRTLLEAVKDEMEFLAASESPPLGLKRDGRRPSSGAQTGGTSHSRSKSSSKGDTMRSTG